MVGNPVSVVADDGIREIVLRAKGIGTFRSGYDVTVFADKPGFPVVTADNIRDVIPGIPHGHFQDLGERIDGGLTVYDLVQRLILLLFDIFT